MLDKITTWLKSISSQINLLPDFTIKPIAGDASVRKYYLLNNKQQQFIIMQTPNDPSMHNFINIAKYLTSLKLSCNIPQILAVHNNQPTAFMLISYMGDSLLFKLLNLNNAKSIYKTAWQNLAELQLKANLNLKPMDHKYIKNKLALFKDYYLEKYLNLKNNKIFKNNINSLLFNLENYFTNIFKQQPQVFVHLDYHSKNLLITNNKLSILDFQDAMQGPITYDIASLLQDAYLIWPEQLTEQVLKNYYNYINHNIKLNINFKDFIRYFYLTGLQRHLKNLGVFARLNYLYNKTNYLQYIPNLLHYINMVCSKFKEPELNKLTELLQCKP